MRPLEEFHSHPFENEEFRQLCEMKRKKGVFLFVLVLFFVSFLFLLLLVILLFYKVVKISLVKIVLESTNNQD